MIQKSVARNAEVLLNLGPWKLFSLACGVEGSKLVAVCSMFKLHGVSK